MNRIEEYNQLIQEAAPPENLSEVLARSLNRAQRARTARRVAVCACAPLAVLVVFTALVNLLPGFAYACGQLPGFRDLAKAVAMSPSLQAAVENKYVQTISQEQEQNGVTMRLEYIIVDRKQLNIFFTLQSPTAKKLDALPQISAADGSRLQGYSLISGDPNVPSGELLCSTVDFSEGEVPSSLQFRAEVRDLDSTFDEAPTQAAPSPLLQSSIPTPVYSPSLANFTFTLYIDPAYLQEGQTLMLNKSFQLGGQTLTAESLEIYPTHIRFNLKDDPTNTAWLKELRFYVQDDKGRRYEPPMNGITATGMQGSPMMPSYRLESAYFARSKSLTLYITGATWLDKDHRRTRIDLAKGAADWLPQGVKLEKAQRTNTSWLLSFSSDLRNGKTMSQLFDAEYYDAKGTRYEVNSWSSIGEDNDWTRFREEFALSDYTDDVVYLSPSFSHVTTEQSPVEIILK